MRLAVLGDAERNVCGRLSNSFEQKFHGRGIMNGFRVVKDHIIGNSMRLDVTSEIRLNERWRSMLTRQDLRTFDAVAGRINRRYGYV